MLTDYEVYKAEVRGSGRGARMVCDGSTLTPRKYVDPATAVTGSSVIGIGKTFEYGDCGFGDGISDHCGGSVTCCGGRYIYAVPWSPEAGRPDMY